MQERTVPESAPADDEPALRNIRHRPRAPRALVVVASAVVAIALISTGSTSVAAAQPPGASIGPPFFVEISYEGQLAIIAGYAAAPGAIVCVVTTGAACAVTPVIVAFITPIVQRAAACPNNGARRLELQNILVPPRPGAIQSEIIQVVSNRCIPA